jgi:hypothetical protein
MSKFQQIANCQYSYEAYLFKAKLESEGIEVFLQNEHSVNTDPVLSNSVGGVILYVYTEDTLRAKHILSEIDKK